MNDEDETPRLRRRIQSGEDRDLARRKQLRSNPLGVPVTKPEPDGYPDEIEHTKPWDFLDRDELSADELEVLENSRRKGDDPVIFRDIVKIMARAMRKELDERSEERRQLGSVREILGRPTGAVVTTLQTDIADLKRDSRLLKWVAGGVLTLALGSAGMGFGALWSRAAHEGAAAADMQRLKDDVQKLLSGEYAPRNHNTKEPQP